MRRDYSCLRACVRLALGYVGVRCSAGRVWGGVSRRLASLRIADRAARARARERGREVRVGLGARERESEDRESYLHTARAARGVGCEGVGCTGAWVDSA